MWNFTGTRTSSRYYLTAAIDIIIVCIVFRFMLYTFEKVPQSRAPKNVFRLSEPTAHMQSLVTQSRLNLLQTGYSIHSV